MSKLRMCTYNDSAPCDSNHDSAFQNDAKVDPVFAERVLDSYTRDQTIYYSKSTANIPQEPQPLFNIM